MRKFEYWLSCSSVYKKYFLGIYQELDSVSGTIRVLESGVYVLAVVVTLKDAKDSFEIGQFELFQTLSFKIYIL